MIFVLHKTLTEISAPEGPEPTGLWVRTVRERWTWDYRQGTDKNPGDTLAVCPKRYDSEREARSAIAKARRAFGGARMAKVCQSSDLAVDNG